MQYPSLKLFKKKLHLAFIFKRSYHMHGFFYSSEGDWGREFHITATFFKSLVLEKLRSIFCCPVIP